ncbi:MAG: hypothetical protein JXR40_10690 [Pontiellaceae bacterium]|nr:hypothetical protein [Pontiellaceae bacterium]
MKTYLLKAEKTFFSTFSMVAVAALFLSSNAAAETPPIWGARYEISPMSLNASGFISWIKVANPGTNAVAITANIYWTLADGTEGSVSGVDLGSVDAGGVATVGEASILYAMGDPTQLADVVVTIYLANPKVIVHAEKKASDGRLIIPVERYYELKDPYDTDQDGMRDYWEQIIINDNLDDNITTIADVLPGDDYDNDGATNLEEYMSADPTDPNSLPPAS